MTIKEIIQKLNTTMTDAGGHESHFESWLILNEGIVDAIDALKALDKQDPVAWEQFYPDIGKPQLEQLPQLSQEVVLQYPKEAVDWQKQQKEYAQQLKVEGPCNVVCQCDKCKAQEQDNAYIYASNLAKTIWQKHYIKESPKFALLDTTEGVLTQIDNMTCGLVREKPAQPEQEPVGWRVTYSKVIKALAAIVTVHTPDNLFDLDAIPRDPVMGLVQQIRVAIDGYRPPQRKPLSDEEMKKIWYAMQNIMGWYSFQEIARAIEAAHNIKE